MTSFRDRIARSFDRTTRATRLASRGPGSARPTLDLTHLFPTLSRRADAAELRRLARTLVVQAVRDECAREGLDYIDIPDPLTRQSLAEANIGESNEYRTFTALTMKAFGFDAPQICSEDDMKFLLNDAASVDEFGFTIEATRAAACFLVARAAFLDRGEAAANAAHGDLIADCAKLEGFARDQLKATVTQPHELRSALQRREAAPDHSPHATSDVFSRHTKSAKPNEGKTPVADDSSSLSMAEIMRHAAAVQDFLKTEQGQKAMALGGTAVAMGSKYMAKRTKKTT